MFLAPLTHEFKLTTPAVGMGAVAQFRVMGGAIVLSIATSVFNSYTKPRIAELLGASGAAVVYGQSVQSIANLGPLEQQRMRLTLARGYNLQMWVMCAFAALQVPTALLLWRRKPILV